MAAALRQRRPQPAGRPGAAPPGAATAAAAAAGGTPGTRPGARGPDGRRLPRGVASPGQPGVLLSELRVFACKLLGVQDAEVRLAGQ